MDLLIISEISLGISIVAFFVIGMIKFYNFAYNQGFSHGDHVGFTRGFFKGKEVKNNKRKEVYV